MCCVCAAATLASGCSLDTTPASALRPLNDQGVSLVAAIQPLGDRGLELNLRLTNSSTKDYVVADGVPASASTKDPQLDASRIYAVKHPELTEVHGGKVVELALRTFEPWPSTPTPGPLLMRGSLLRAGKTHRVNRKIKDIGILNSPFKGVLGKDYRPEFAYVCVGIVPVTAVDMKLQPKTADSGAPNAPASSTPSTVGTSPVLAHSTQQYQLCSSPEELRK